MSSLQESHCPICRCPYNHFPSICLLLHFLLRRVYPVAYRRREKQILVYCKSCVDIPANEALKCQLRQSSHPKGVPKVCLELDHFLEEQFAEEYMVRRAAQTEPLACVTEGGNQENQSVSSCNAAWLSEYGSKLGCDYCGGKITHSTV